MSNYREDRRASAHGGRFDGRSGQCPRGGRFDSHNGRNRFNNRHDSTWDGRFDDHSGRRGNRFDGFGGMLSFRPAGGVEAAQGLIDRLRLPFDAPSLGGVESLITRPAATSHAGMSPHDRLALGVTDDLVRVSVGVESPEDLIADFGGALTTS